MIGVTIRKGPEFHSLSEKGVELFKKHTGIKNVAIFDTDDDNPYIAKLTLPYIFDQTFVFFDADHWFVNDCDLSQYDNKEEIFAVPDLGRFKKEDFPQEDCYWNGIDQEDYFNTGFFIANGRNQKIKKAFHYALGLSQRLKVKDFGEQSYLNIAIQRMGVPFVPLAYGYNYAILCDQYPERAPNTSHHEIKHPFAIHALGYQGSEKKKALNKYLKIKRHEHMQLPPNALPLLQPELRATLPAVLPLPRAGHNGDGGQSKGNGRQRRRAGA